MVPLELLVKPRGNAGAGALPSRDAATQAAQAEQRKNTTADYISTNGQPSQPAVRAQQRIVKQLDAMTRFSTPGGVKPVSPAFAGKPLAALAALAGKVA